MWKILPRISSEMLMCGGGVRSILLLSLVAGCMHRDNRCMYMAHVDFYVCCGECLCGGQWECLLCSGRC